MSVSLVLASFQRAHLLNIGLASIVKNAPTFPLEIVVVNDGQEDETKSVVDSYKDKLNIKYFFLVIGMLLRLRGEVLSLLIILASKRLQGTY